VVNPIWFNVQSFGLSGSQKDDYIALIKRTRPRVQVIHDDLPFATWVKQSVPESIVVYRDDRWGGGNNAHKDMKPDEIVRGYQSAFQAGLAAYINNESGFDSEVINHLLRVAELAEAVGGKTCLGNWSVGVPEPHQIPLADALIRFCAEHSHFIGLHEGDYQSDLMRHVPDYTGRFMRIVERQRVLTGNRALNPFIIITEMGWSNLRVNNQLLGAPIVPSMVDWRAQGIADPELHAYRELVKVWERVYEGNNVAGLCCFQYGGRTTRPSSEHPFLEWTDWDYNRLPRLVGMISNYEYKDDVPMATIRVQLNHKHSSVKWRAAPGLTGAWITSLPSGVIIRAFSMILIKDGDGYEWLKGQLEDGREGYVAIRGPNNYEVEAKVLHEPTSIKVTLAVDENGAVTTYSGELPKV
jgi:hypothetical protein